HGGVLITSMPASVNTAAKAAVNFASRSRSRNRSVSVRRSRSISTLRAYPRAGRGTGHPGDLYLPGSDLDEEEHVDPFEEDRVDGEEVAGQNAAGLGGEKLPPRGARRAGRRVDAGAVQDVPHGAGRDLVAQANQFTVD